MKKLELNAMEVINAGSLLDSSCNKYLWAGLIAPAWGAYSYANCWLWNTFAD